MPTRAPAPILPLTSVRFLAALYVVLHHGNLWQWHLGPSTLLGRFLANGFTAVSFFFVLSGFVLAFVYLERDPPFERRAFWIARFARIYPLLFLSILLDVPNRLIIIASKQGLHAAVKAVALGFVSGALLLQAWLARFRVLNTPAWSLSAEAFFYFIFPFVAPRLWRLHRGRALFALVALWLAAMAAPVLITATHPALASRQDTSKLQVVSELNPLLRSFEFLAGIALCSLHRTWLGQLAKPARSRLAHAFILLALILFAIVIADADHVPIMVMNTGALLPCFCLLILGLANVEGPLASVLSHPVPVLLGEASFAVYLLHNPIWEYLSRIHAIDSAPRWSLFFSILLGASLGSFLFLERPARSRLLALAALRPGVTLRQESAART